MQIVWIITVIFQLAIFATIVCVKANKSYRLTVLVLLQHPETIHWEIAQIILDEMAIRNDLLPDYTLEFQYEDENSGYQSVKKIIQFRDNIKPGSYQAPIIIGPEFSTGCKAFGPVLPYVHMVDLSATCTAPIFYNHAAYPNIYLTQQTQQFTTLAILHFIRDIGNWNRFALLTSTNNVNDYTSALLMHKIAIENGFTISWFSMVPSIDEELVTSIKATDARVIVIYSGDDIVTFPFLCLAYNVGLTGPRYVFIANTAAIYYDPAIMTNESYEGCTREIILTQLRQTYWIDPALDFDADNRTSQLGHSRHQFDLLLGNRLANSSGRNVDDPYRYLLYDCFLKAIFALHGAEERLRQTRNLTLRDYAEVPQIVMEAVNDSVKTINISGLHADRLSYSKSGLPENEGPTVVQWSPERGLVTVALGQQNSSLFDYQHYLLRVIRKITWLPADGNPPRDYRKTIRLVRKVPLGVLIAVAALAALITVMQIRGSVAWFLSTDFQSVIKFSQLAAQTGCLLLNTSAVLFVCDHQLMPAIIFLVIGLSASNGVLAVRGIILRTCVSLWMQHTRTSRMGRTATPSRRHTVIFRHATNNWHHFEITTLTRAPLFVLINGLILISWMITDPIICAMRADEPVYMIDSDVYLEVFQEVCTSKYLTAWSLGITLLHCLLLLFSYWLTYLARKTGFFPPRFTIIQVGLGNSTILLLGVFLLALALRDPIKQVTALAFGTLINSAVTSVVIVAFGIHRPTDSSWVLS